MYSVTSCIVVAVILPVLAIIAVILRFYVRHRLTRAFIGIDDWLILISVILVCGQGAIQIVGATIGLLGRDGEPGPPDPQRLKHATAVDSAVLVVEKVTYTTIKLSVLFFYRRIFYRQRAFRISNDVLIGIITAWGISFFVTEFLVCGADAAPGGHPCSPREWFLLWFGITDILTDIAVLSLPYPCIRKLQIDRREKIGLSMVFFLGTLSVVFGLIRLAFVGKTFDRWYHPKKYEGQHPERTPPFFWTTVEVSVGILAACLPPLGPLFKKAPRLKNVYALKQRHYRSHNKSSQMQKLMSKEHDVEVSMTDTPSENFAHHTPQPSIDSMKSLPK